MVLLVSLTLIRYEIMRFRRLALGRLLLYVSVCARMGGYVRTVIFIVEPYRVKNAAYGNTIGGAGIVTRTRSLGSGTG